MVAGKGSSGIERRSIATGNSFASHALRSASIFGPNGAGKSSLLEAINFFVNFVEDSAKNATEGDDIDVTPFRLSKTLRAAASEFEVIFIHEGTLYQYGFVVDKTRVYAEWLFSRPNEAGSRMRQLFQREFDEVNNNYAWEINENYVKGEREIWKKSTRDNALFLSTAVQLNSISLRQPFVWISGFLIVLPPPENFPKQYSAALCKSDETKHDVLNFVRSADLMIEDIKVDETEVTLPKDIEEFVSETGLMRLKESTKKAKHLRTSTFHRSQDGELVEFDINEESAGTQVLFALACSWIDVLREGYTLFVDELHNSLHPVALKHLIEMFHDPAINKKGAQLVFTTHDTTIISGGFMHRDQIWIIEKREGGASHLYPLSDFNVRGSEAFGRAYLSGVFGGLPHPTEFSLGE
nr:ATP-binding protein [Agrobacterium vitis]